MARIAVIGSGAVGGYYGARLAQGGHDVRFLCRSDLDVVRRQGLRIYSKDGDFTLPDAQAFGSAAEIGPVDWVVCSLKATAIEEARELVAPCLGPTTRILALMNGLGIEGRFGEWFGAERVFGGMAFVCINRGEPGVIHHLDYGRVTIGHLADDASQTEELRALLASGNIDVSVAPSLLYARWEKLCWNVPFNGLSVAGGGIGTRTILDSALLRETAQRAMREVVRAGNADLESQGSAARLDAEEVTARMFALTETMGDYRTSMVIDYVMGRPLESEAILGNPVRRAGELGVEVPTMATLYSLVTHAGRVRAGEQAVLRPEDLASPTVV